jgi:hypothetical protein
MWRNAINNDILAGTCCPMDNTSPREAQSLLIQVALKTWMSRPRDSMWSVRLSVASRGNLPYTNSCPPVQLGLNVNGLTDLNGGSPVPLLSRGPPVPLEQPTVFACILSQLWVPLGNVPYTNSCSPVQLGLHSLNDMHRVKHVPAV